jgi:hypothetical protein
VRATEAPGGRTAGPELTDPADLAASAPDSSIWSMPIAPARSAASPLNCRRKIDIFVLAAALAPRGRWRQRLSTPGNIWLALLDRHRTVS